MTKLGDDDVNTWLQQHQEWRRDGDTLRRDIECPSFLDAVDLVRRIADEAEERDHHPDIDIRWRTLHLALSTHSEGGITTKDTDLASTIDELAG